MTTEQKPGGLEPGWLVRRFPALERLRERWRGIPEVRQLSVTDCGAACLAMVLGYHGREISLDEAREVTGSGRDGVNARLLLDCGRKLGLRGRAASIDLDQLPYLPPASILHWDFNHYVVFERMAGTGCTSSIPLRAGGRCPWRVSAGTSPAWCSSSSRVTTSRGRRRHVPGPSATCCRC